MKTSIGSVLALSRSLRLGAALLVVSAVGAFGAAAPASASFGIKPGSFVASLANQDGTPDTQAGSHPFESTTSFSFNTTTDFQGATIPDGNAKDIHVSLPAGLIGDARATPQCPQDVFHQNTQGLVAAPPCPDDTAVGTTSVTIVFFGSAVTLYFPVYNLVPPPGVPAEFGFAVLFVPVTVDISVRTGSDYGLTANISNLSQGVPLLGTSLTLWGVPADPAHDPLRGKCLNTDGTSGGSCPSHALPKPLLTLPTSCSGPLTTVLQVDSWEGGFDQQSSTMPVGVDGCDRLSFAPSISAVPDTTVADSPAGLDVDVHVPQAPDVPGGLATSALKNASVTLPAGFSLSPAAADGLQGCTSAQIGLSDASEPTCPDASKIGSAEIDSPISADPLAGSIYLAQPHQNPFGSLVAIYVVAEADGVQIKLAGNVQPDPPTGQITTTFDNNPQLPFSDLKLDFFGGPRAVFASPESCGTFVTTSDLSPFSAPVSGPDATPSSSFSITSGCVGGFSPTFTAGTTNPQAGAFSPFAVSFSRSDTDQQFSGLSVTLPPGMLAKLAGVAECSETQIAQARGNSAAAELANPSCPAASQVGTAVTGAGAGSDPIFTPGKVYLTGPYKGAPYGLVVIVPALAGPFDLGTVVVRQALFVDPTDAHVTVVSDPFPTILQGIPLRLQRVDVVLNRPGFTLNPTSCDPSQVAATLSSIAGATDNFAPRFQVGGCEALGFGPKLAISLSGQGKTRSGNHPTLTANLAPRSGQANIANARVTLPLSLALDPVNSTHVCSYAAAQAVHGGAVGCPANTIVGSASATTPLLSQPLTGNVYLVQGIRFNGQGQPIRTLPTLLIPLRGQLALDLRATTAVNSIGDLVSNFSTVPDVPVSAFKLVITGGPKGLLVITGRGQSICTVVQTATATLDAHSGNQESLIIKMGTPCGRGAAHRRARHARARHSRRG